jgi:hypothetical protein
MSLSRRMLVTALIAAVAGWAAADARADQVWTVTVNTSQMASDYTSHFGIDFELIGTDGNTVTLSNFSFGTGNVGPGAAFLTGGASGDLSTTVSLSDSASFFNDFNQGFTPGNTLTFTIDSTLLALPPAGSPDNFSMVLFEGYDRVNGYNPYTGSGGTLIPTLDPTGNDTFFNFNINGPGSTTVSTFSSTSGDITITVTPATTVPEPSSSALMLLGVICSEAAICQRRSGGRRSASSR